MTLPETLGANVENTAAWDDRSRTFEWCQRVAFEGMLWSHHDGRTTTLSPDNMHRAAWGFLANTGWTVHLVGRWHIHAVREVVS